MKISELHRWFLKESTYTVINLSSLPLYLFPETTKSLAKFFII